MSVIMEKLTIQQILVLEEMNRGMYLMTTGKTEGLARKDRISSMVKSGSVKALLLAGLIYKSDTRYKDGGVRYLLTDAGRTYRKL